MKKFTLSIALFSIFVGSFNAQAANDDKKASHNITVGIESHALVGLSSEDAITLQPAAPDVAGDGLDFSAGSTTNSSIWLNYSSIISKSSNSISVSMIGDDLPNGVTIELLAADDAKKGKGKVGTSTGKGIELEEGKDKVIISDIKNGYTGTGINAGHQLTYTLKMDDTGDNYADLTAKDFTTTITYTITEN
jgi:hypothetical protein